MAREFYTEKDIEDLVKRGILSLQVNDDVVLTELAYEKANRLGMQLLRATPDLPPSAPVRPYVNQKPGQAAPHSNGSAPRLQPAAAAPVLALKPQTDGGRADGPDLRQRIRSAVIARLGTQVDEKLLDAIITRVLNATGVR